MAVEPISPDDIAKAKSENIPDEVFEVVNRLLALKYTHGRATILQEDIVFELCERGLSRNVIFNKGYLNFEEAYRSKGWNVKYDKPAYCEDYAANFVFTMGAS
jgi:hypothetical protein